MRRRARTQPPVRSPLSIGAVLAPLGRGDPRPQVAARLSALCGDGAVLLTDSGTSALSVALRAAVRRRPGYCALPGYGCYDLASAALGAGVPVILYDLEPESLLPRLESLLPLVTGECAAVVVVDAYGIPAVGREIREACRRSGTLLVEDAAQAAGASLDGRRAGTMGDVGVLSFGRGKGVTGGGGGALVLPAGGPPLEVPSLADAPRASAFRMSALLAAQWLLARPGLYAVPRHLPFLRLGETVYRVPRPAAAMPAAMARVLRRTLDSLDDEAARRRLHAARLQRAAVRGIVAVRAAHAPAAGWLRQPVLVPEGTVPPDRVQSLGVARAYPIALRALAPMAPAIIRDTATPGCDALARDLWTLPTHGALGEAELRVLEEWLGGAQAGAPA